MTYEFPVTKTQNPKPRPADESMLFWIDTSVRAIVKILLSVKKSTNCIMQTDSNWN